MTRASVEVVLPTSRPVLTNKAAKILLEILVRGYESGDGGPCPTDFPNGFPNGVIEISSDMTSTETPTFGVETTTTIVTD